MSSSESIYLKHLKQKAHLLNSSLSNRLSELYISDYPTESPQILIDLLQKLIKQISKKIDELNSKDEIVLICNLITEFSNFFEVLDNANSEQTPNSIAYLIEELFYNLYPGAIFLLWPSNEYNYSIENIIPSLKDTVKNLFVNPQELNDIFEESNKQLSLISFPRIERDNLLNHVILGHELGHPFADNFIYNDELGDKYKKGLEECSKIIDIEFQYELDKSSNSIEKTFKKNTYLKNLMI